MAVMNMVNGGVASSPNLLLWLPSSHFCSIPLAVGKPHALDVAEIKNKSLDICSFFFTTQELRSVLLYMPYVTPWRRDAYEIVGRKEVLPSWSRLPRLIAGMCVCVHVFARKKFNTMHL